MPIIRTAVAFLALFAAASAVAQATYLDTPTSYAPNGFLSSNRLIAIGDVNSDGRDDLVTVGGAIISTMLSTAQGEIGAPNLSSFGLPGNTGFFSPALSDFDQDGNLDLVVGEQATGYQVFRGDGAGGWTLWPVAIAPLPTPYVYGLRLVDLDLDGVAEFVFQAYGLNGPSGVGFYVVTFNSGVLTYAGVLPVGLGSVMTFADFNGDGFQDVITYFAAPNAALPSGVQVSFGNGTLLGFGPAVLIPYPFPATNRFTLITMDANGDGRDDLILHRWEEATVGDTTPPPSEAWITTDLITTLTWASFPTPGMSSDVRVTDINQDGVPDLIGMESYAPSSWPNMAPRTQIGVHLGNGTGGFLAPQLLVPPSGMLHWGLRLADVDGDGDPDPFMSQWPNGSIGLFRNRARFASACAAPGTPGPQLITGTPSLGNPAFTIGVTDTLPNSGALLGLSLARSQATAPCQILIDVSPTNLILPLGSGGFTTTDATGTASVSIPIPNNPALRGISAFAQWGVLNPATPLGVALTQGAEMIIW